MRLSMHTASVPAFVRTLTAMSTWLDKAEAHAAARKFDAANYLTLRLAPDMLPLAKQVQIASDMVKGCVARLAGQESPSWADDESTIEQLKARIAKTIDYVQSVPASLIDGSDERAIELPTRTGEPRRFTGESYLTQFVLPNFYFHATALYALLRGAGVELGKRDFLGL